MSRCAVCRRDVLLHVTLDGADRERIRCVACDAEVDPDCVRWVAAAEMGVLGYAIEGEVEPGGCGRPGCGGGRCGRATEPQ